MPVNIYQNRLVNTAMGGGTIQERVITVSSAPVGSIVTAAATYDWRTASDSTFVRSPLIR